MRRSRWPDISRLNRLIVLFDDNEISIDGATSLSCSDDQLARFKASGWSASRIDGHDPEAIAAAIEQARRSDRPSLIACRTVIGFGAPNRQGSEKAHGAPLGAEEVAKTRAALDWPLRAVPDSGVRPCAMAQDRRARACGPPKLDRADQASQPGARSPFHDALNRNLPYGYAEAMTDIRDRFAADKPEHRDAAGVATRDRRDRRSVAELARRLGRSHPFQPDARQDAPAGECRLPLTATISTTASASTPWRPR